MKLKDSFMLSLNSIAHRKLRAWLTLLGIIIGVASVVSIVSIGYGAQESINASMSTFGADVITISPSSSRASSMGGMPPGMMGGGEGGFGGAGGSSGRSSKTSSGSTTSSELKDSDIAVIKSNSDVVAINQKVSGRTDVTFNSKEAQLTVTGINPLTWMDTTSVTVASGRNLGPSDTRSVLIGSSVASTVFDKSVTLGRQIDINGKYFTVVGILKSSGSSFGGGADQAIYMNYKAAWDVLESDVNKNTYTSIEVKVSDASKVDEDLNAIQASLLASRRLTTRTQNFTITSSQTIKEQISSITNTLTLFLGAIAAISLLVGAIGIANSMFTSVMEKTRDIGVMKALGATNSEVLLVFVIEAGLFGLIGGIIGVLIAYSITIVFNALGISIGIMSTGPRGSTSEMLITPELVIFAIVLSTIIGIISGLVPARNAAKMKPVDALKYE